MNDERMVQIKNFIESVRWARENGLEVEFVESFLQEFESTKSIPSAIWFATREWDL